jgi:hypothetical protein
MTDFFLLDIFEITTCANTDNAMGELFPDESGQVVTVFAPEKATCRQKILIDKFLSFNSSQIQPDNKLRHLTVPLKFCFDIEQLIFNRN